MRCGHCLWSLFSVTGLLYILIAFSLISCASTLPGSVSSTSPTNLSGPQSASPAKESNSSTVGKEHASTVSGVFPPNKPRTQRALVVLMVVSAAVIVYFVIRTIRSRRKNRKTRKYGVLDTNIGNMELTPLEQDDEDDDTLFDANHPRR
ncbi:membrane protein FAM174A [Bombina bombina]|uniref:membrane protein FAM174A n=1 Tax=Bombina bombina TaxID=8345 RepID=UPI00235AC4AE|nr:membrane protein FAM174A [Bombina bombina]